MPRVAKQVSGGQITAPSPAQSHQALISQHAKLVLRQEQLLQFQQRLLLAQGNPVGSIPFPAGAESFTSFTWRKLVWRIEYRHAKRLKIWL